MTALAVPPVLRAESLNINAALNYDAVVTSEEISYANTHPTTSKAVNVVLGQHSVKTAGGSSGRCYVSQASLTTGFGMPSNGVVDGFQCATTYGNVAGNAPVPNVVEISVTSTGTTAQASQTITLPASQQKPYSDLGILFCQSRSNSSSTAGYRTAVSVTYTDESTQTLFDTGLVPVAANNTPGGTLGSAGVNGVGGLESASDSSSAVALSTSFNRGATVSGSGTSAYTNIGSTTLTRNLWKPALPWALNSGKSLKSVTFTLAASTNGRFNSLYLFAMSATPAAPANALYVNPVAGNDANAGTTPATAVQTLSRALQLASAGWTIFLKEGNYPPVIHAAQPGLHFKSGGYVTIKPDPAVANPLQSVSIERLQFGSRSGTLTGPNREGTYDVYLRVEDLKIPNGVFLYGGKHLEISGCRIERFGPWTGSEADIAKAALDINLGNDVLIEDCEVTNTAIGLALTGLNVRALRNNIHHITHDGIRCVSLHNSLVEGNRIYNLDDGVEDSEATWSKHCDAIHIFVPGPGTPGLENDNVILRNNVMFDCESQGVQFNNYYGNTTLKNSNITFENNVFGPTRANAVNIADPVDGLIFRNNSFVPIAGGRTFQGTGRQIVCNNTTFRINTACTATQVFNNILTNSFAKASGWFSGYNVIVSSSPLAPPTRFDVLTTDAKYVSPSSFDGRVASDSPAINIGTRLAPAGIYPTDLYGVARDLRPDAGAVELAGQNPPAEPQPPTYTGPTTVYLEDFKDADLAKDPWLNGNGQEGLAWVAGTGLPTWNLKTIVPSGGTRRTIMSPQTFIGPVWMLTTEGANWADYTVTEVARNAYNTASGGLLVRANDAGEGYLVDYVKGQIILKKIVSGVMSETVLATGSPLLTAANARTFKVIVATAGNSASIKVDADANGSFELEAMEATESFAAGRAATYNASVSSSHCTTVESVRVDVQRRVP